MQTQGPSVRSSQQVSVEHTSETFTLTRKRKGARKSSPVVVIQVAGMASLLWTSATAHV